MSSRPYRWLALFFLIGLVLVFLYPDGDQQDAGYHYLFARWAWAEPGYFIGVWSRPLFTLLYSLPAQVGYPATKIFTLLISLATAWQTFCMARDVGMARAQLAVPLLLLQPAFFLLFSVTLTEPLFALLFVVALRLDYHRKKSAAAWVVSLLILVRPEGFFVCVVWAVRLLFGGDGNESWLVRVGRVAILGIGVAVWWLCTLLVSGDPLWLAHNWPSDWQPFSKTNLGGPFWWYVAILPLIVGPFFLPQFVRGLIDMFRGRVLVAGLYSFLAIYLVHAIMYARGWFGDAGYPRYLVCVAPITALATLTGWNRFALLQRRVVTGVLLSAAFLVCLFYVDGYLFTRDSRAVDEVAATLPSGAMGFQRLVFSQSYMCIRLGCKPLHWLPMTSERARNLELLRSSPAETMVFWDSDVGPKWYGLSAEDFAGLGFRKVLSRSFVLNGRFFRLPWKHHGGSRLQEMHVFYK